jgi:hypothetical protein
MLKAMFTLAYKSTPKRVREVPTFPTITEDNIRIGFVEAAQYHAIARESAKVACG